MTATQDLTGVARNPGTVFYKVSSPSRHMLITGVGRGGTTACAIMLEKFGFVFENPSEYRESRALRMFIQNRDSDGARRHLESWNASAERMAWKDPKLRGFTGLLQNLPETVGVLFVFRDPLKIAIRNTSMIATNVITEVERAAKSTIRTAQVLTEVIRRRQNNVALVSYESLLVDREQTVRSVAEFLNVSDELAVNKAIDAIRPSPEEYRKYFGPRVTD